MRLGTCALLGAAGAQGLGCASSAAAPLAAGVPSPAFTPPAEFAFESLDQRPVTSDATRGKPTVLVFVTTSSLPAQAQVDFLSAMAKNDDGRINYAAVVLVPSTDRELVELYKKALAIPFPVAIADARTLDGGGAFGDLRAVPVTVMLDREGRAVWRVEGRVAKSDELRGALRGL